jgi:hypothetical protein
MIVTVFRSHVRPDADERAADAFFTSYRIQLCEQLRESRFRR